MSKFFALATCLLCLPVLADDNFEISGFGTLGLVQLHGDRFGYRTDVSHVDGTFEGEWDLRTTSVLGVQPEYRITPEVDFVSQFIYRDQNTRSLDTMTSLAFFQYKPSPQWSFRFGRTAIDLFHLTEYRDVGFAYPWAKTPSEVYGIVAYRHLDGADATYSTQIGHQTLRSRIFAGVSRADISSYEFPEETKIDNIIGLSLELEAFEWRIKANFNTVKFEDNNDTINTLENSVRQYPDALWPNNESFADDLSMKNKRGTYASLSGVYDFENVTLMSEVSMIRGDSVFVRDINSGYASVIYHYGAHSFYTTYGYSEADTYEFDETVNFNLMTPQQQQATAELIGFLDLTANFFAAEQKSMSIGWRWNINERLALKAQWERTKIADEGVTLWLNKDFLDSKGGTVHTFYTNLSFIF